MLGNAQIERYSRQIILPEVGGRGQQILLGARVAILGWSRAAWITSLYLTAAGIGRLDVHATAAEPSSDELRHLGDLNADTDVRRREPAQGVPEHGAADLAQVLIEASGARTQLLAANATALLRGLPLIAGGADGSRGWVAVFAGHRSEQPCAACAQPAWDRQPKQVGQKRSPLASVVDGFIGAAQALAVLRLLLELQPDAAGVVTRYDAETANFEQQVVAKRGDCPACGSGRSKQ